MQKNYKQRPSLLLFDFVLHCTFVNMPSKHREITVDDKIAIHCFFGAYRLWSLRREAIGEAADKFKRERTSI